MSLGLFEVLGALIGLVIGSAFFGVRQVSQGHILVVERLGKFHRELSPGLRFVIPFIEKVAYRVSTKDLIVPIEEQSVISSDNAILTTSATAYISVISPRKAVYGVESFESALKILVQTSLRSIIGTMTLNECLSARERIKVELKAQISEQVSNWGLSIRTIEIEEVLPSASMAKSMEEQSAAIRQKKSEITLAEGQKEARVLEAQGIKESLILKSEGELEASRRESEAQVILAEASKLALEKIGEAVSDNSLKVQYLLAEKYIESLQDLSSSANSKVVVYPADLTETLKGFMKTPVK